ALRRCRQEGIAARRLVTRPSGREPQASVSNGQDRPAVAHTSRDWKSRVRTDSAWTFPQNPTRSEFSRGATMPAPLVSYSEISNSTYLDLTSYRGNAALPTSDRPADTFSFNVALVLGRANGNDPTALLNADWATRQKLLAALEQSGTLWSTYG